jgi:magnesium chelatase family protein
MPIPLFSLAARGLDAELVKIEVDHYTSQPGTVIVGLGDTAVQESRERVRAAIKNSGFSFPRGKVVVNLAPADVRKSGPCYDLPIALAMIAISHKLDFPSLDDCLFFGELALDGSLRHVNGILSLMSIARERGFKRIFVPAVNSEEATLIPELTIYPAESLQQVVRFLSREIDLEPAKPVDLDEYFCDRVGPFVDFADIKGQSQAKRGLEIAAAGGHNIMMNGSPGSGKTMMARALQGILPPMSLSEALEVTKIYSLSGLLPEREFLIRRRPFRMVHHTASGAALVGGGRIPKPGEISLAHRGVLFLDEMAEFPASVLELLRQPLEDRQITISRAFGSLTYPAQFILCAAMNPCPCGYYNVPKSTKICQCSPSIISRYQHQISGPMLDRIDLNCSISPVDYGDLQGQQQLERSSTVLERVITARQRQARRFADLPCSVNSEMSAKNIQEHCRLNQSVQQILEQAMRTLHLSARAYHRIIKVSRTIADLTDRDEIHEGDVLEALQYRRIEGMGIAW